MPAVKCRFAIHIGLRALSYVTLLRQADNWRVSGYGDVPWLGHAGTTELQQEDLEATIKQVVHEQGLHREAVHVSLNSRYSVSRVVTGTRSSVHAQFEEITANSQHYLQFGLGEKLIGRSTLSLGDGEYYGQVAIIKHGLLEMVDKSLQRAGLRIDSVDGAMPNLCRLIGQLELDHAPLLLVWITNASAEIGISYRGKLQLSYQLGGESSPQAVAEIIRKHLKRLRRFCDRYRSVDEATQLNHMLVLASGPHAQELRAQLEGSSFESVRSLDWLVSDKLSDRFILGEQLPSPGVVTALAGLLPQLDTDVLAFTDVLEKYVHGKPRTVSSILLVDALPTYLAAMLVCVLFGWSLWLQLQIDDTLQQSQELQLTQAVEREQMLELEQLRMQTRHIRQQHAEWYRPPEHELIVSIAGCLPADTRLESFAIETTGRLILKGTMLNGDRSFELLQTLRQLPAIEEVALESVSKARTFGITNSLFEIHCQLDSKALQNTLALQFAAAGSEASDL
jgi:hypothetical protein